jgi:hypothetical protein
MLILFPISSLARRAIPDNNLAFPILITIDNNIQGSGFFIDSGSSLFLVTAKHVIFDKNGSMNGKIASLLCYPPELFSKGKIIIEVDLSTQNKNGNIRIHPTHDVVAINVGSIVKKDNKDSIFYNIGINQIQSAGSGIVGLSKSNTTLFKNILISNQVYVFGYPTSIGIKNIPQIDYDIPLLRTGIISGINQSKEYIIIDCPIYQGNSGGPVIQVDQQDIGTHVFTVIGIVSQFVPFAEYWENKTNKYINVNISNSGYAVVVPIDKVLEIIK